MPLIEVLAAMERAGVKLDAERLAEIGDGHGRADRRARGARSSSWPGTSSRSARRSSSARCCSTSSGLTKKRRGKTGFSTDARVLAQIRDEHEIVAKVESWRELTKLKNTYLDALPELIDPETGRIHTTFNQVAAATGRLSSINPNLQNIPIRSEVGRPVRACFVAERGMRLLSADYNQVELRVLAHVAGEDVLREIFASGEDVHAATAAEVLGARARRGGPGRALEGEDGQLRDRLRALGVRARRPAADLPRGGGAYIERYFERFPAVKRFIDETIAKAERDGFVSTLLGRRRAIPELRSNQRQRRWLGERLAVNTVIQGTAADIIKVAMVRCHAALAEAGMETRLVLQIHDELLFEGPEAEMDPATELVREGWCGLRPRPAAGGRRRRRRGLARRKVRGPSEPGCRPARPRRRRDQNAGDNQFRDVLGSSTAS